MEIICSLNIFIPLVCEEEQQKIAAKKAFELQAEYVVFRKKSLDLCEIYTKC